MLQQQHLHDLQRVDAMNLQRQQHMAGWFPSMHGHSYSATDQPDSDGNNAFCFPDQIYYPPLPVSNLIPIHYAQGTAISPRHSEKIGRNMHPRNREKIEEERYPGSRTMIRRSKRVVESPMASSRVSTGVSDTTRGGLSFQNVSAPSVEGRNSLPSGASRSRDISPEVPTSVGGDASGGDYVPTAIAVKIDPN